MFGWLRRQRRRIRQRRGKCGGQGQGWRPWGRGRRWNQANWSASSRWARNPTPAPQTQAPMLSYQIPQISEDVQRKAEEIYKLLPKADCGKCGFDSCYETAIAIAEGRAPSDACRIVGKKIKDKVDKIVGR